MMERVNFWIFYRELDKLRTNGLNKVENHSGAAG